MQFDEKLFHTVLDDLIKTKRIEGKSSRKELVPEIFAKNQEAPSTACSWLTKHLECPMPWTCYIADQRA